MVIIFICTIVVILVQCKRCVEIILMRLIVVVAMVALIVSISHCKVVFVKLVTVVHCIIFFTGYVTILLSVVILIIVRAMLHEDKCSVRRMRMTICEAVFTLRSRHLALTCDTAN